RSRAGALSGSLPVVVLCLSFRAATAAPVAPPVARGAVGSVRGMVRLLSYQPAPDADVALPAIARGTTADGNGRFVIDCIPAGRYLVVATVVARTADRLGVVVAAGDTSRVEMTLGAEQPVVTFEGLEVNDSRPRVVATQIGPRYRFDRKKLDENRFNSLEDV